ncbi:putative Coiled-coil domain-containing protein 12 [Hypsibius exemplaris]|uniref:Coiled-coil domain-containing protein 12 n=1 Tax=Hypsibius exemplaris TaxID=2072580 RepID=A0A1W0WF08_HYPEX|nr:putative Coiled-coil domain-containing protein 12 [Hypsibius exemplaris]
MSDKVGSLELEAQKRRDRLKGLRKAPTDHNAPSSSSDPEAPEIPTENESTETTADAQSATQPKFRSYIPKSAELQENVIEKAAPLDVDGMVADQLEAARPETLPDDVELTNLAPRKPDWDLKRDVAKSLERLDRRTQRAVAELIRERLALQKDTADLAEAVTYGAKIQEEQAAADEW